MGAVSVEVKGTFEIGGSKRLFWGKATMSSSYATNGDTVDAPGDLGYEFAQMTGEGYVLKFDQPTQKVKAFRQTAATSALVEVPNTTNLSAVVADFLAIGP
jgi:hypothetical protein